MQIEVIQCNTEVARESLGTTKFEHQIKKNWFALSKQNVEQLEENAKNRKTVKSYTDLVECLANIATERKVNPKRRIEAQTTRRTRVGDCVIIFS